MPNSDIAVSSGESPAISIVSLPALADGRSGNLVHGLICAKFASGATHRLPGFDATEEDGLSR
jgi:hypothetical protein